MTFHFVCDSERYEHRSKHLEIQLKELKSEIEVMKVSDRESDLDRLHDDQQLRGQNKFSTIQKVSQNMRLCQLQYICNSTQIEIRKYLIVYHFVCFVCFTGDSGHNQGKSGFL